MNFECVLTAQMTSTTLSRVRTDELQRFLIINTESNFHSWDFVGQLKAKKHIIISVP